MATYARPHLTQPPQAGLLRSDEIEGILKPLEEAKPLPPRIYADPDVFAAEQVRILRREWLPVGFLDQVRKPGDYFATDILGEPLLVVCDPDGAVRTYYNVCRHRAMRVAEGSGNQPSFACPYHGWTYDGHGQLVQALHMEQTTAFCMQDIRLLEVRTEVWQNFVLINFDSGCRAARPAACRPRRVPGALGPAQHAPRDQQAVRVPVELENHAGERQRGLPCDGPAPEQCAGGAADRSAYGRVPHRAVQPLPHALRRGAGRGEGTGSGGTTGHSTFRLRSPGLPKSGYEQVEFITVFPCLTFSVQHDSMTAYPIFPHKLDQITFAWVHHMPPGSVGDHSGFAEYIAAQDAMMEEIQREDTDAAIAVQQGWASQGAAPTWLSQLEKTTWQFHRWYARAHEAVAGRARP